MADFTPRLRDAIGLSLLRLDELIDAAKAAIDRGRLARADELLDDALDLKERVVKRIPRIAVGDDSTLAFSEVYWLFDELDGQALLAVLLALVNYVDPKSVSPGDAKLVREHLSELEKTLEKVKKRIVDLPWSGADKQRAIARLDRKLAEIEEEIGRIRDGKEPRRQIVDGLAWFKARLLDEVSESVSLWDVYWYLRALDDGLKAAQFRLTALTPEPGEAKKKLDQVVAWKHQLERIIDGTDRRSAPRPERHPWDFPFPLPPLPEGQSYV